MVSGLRLDAKFHERSESKENLSQDTFKPVRFSGNPFAMEAIIAAKRHVHSRFALLDGRRLQGDSIAVDDD